MTICIEVSTLPSSLSSGPQCTIQTRDGKAGGEVAAIDFGFKNPMKAENVFLKDLYGQ